MSNEVSYNGYTFNDYSHYLISGQMVEDDAQRTVVYHRYKLRVITTITADNGEAAAGDHFKRIRQRLTKQGQALKISHAGFGPAFEVNTSATAEIQDVAFGPKPQIVNWDPVGHTNAVEVVWECEFCVPVCDGESGTRYRGVMAFNYGMSHRLDLHGYCTRTISGYLEIAMTRNDRRIPDTADAYRDYIAVNKPSDYERETSWNLSPDKRRLDFTIVDTQIRSANPYPPGVIRIRGNHRVGWSRRSISTLPNTISATIELEHGKPRGFAWEVFRSIVASRIAYATGGNNVFLETMEVDEELYGHSIAFSISYRIYNQDKRGALVHIFDATGIFQKPPGNWDEWSASVAAAQNNHGVSNLRNFAEQDQIVDLCLNEPLANYPIPGGYPVTPGSPLRRFCNPKPSPRESWLRFEPEITFLEYTPTAEQITVGEDDLERTNFDPSNPNPDNGATLDDKEIERIIETAPAGLRVRITGYAERVGYPIPKPDTFEIAGRKLYRIGEGVFGTKFLGKHFCQPLYGAAWNMIYVIDERPESVEADEVDPIHLPPEEGDEGGY